MADSPFELSVDSDWKKQAQEEKRKLAEEAEKQRTKSTAAPASPAGAAAAPGSPAAPDAAGRRRRPNRERPPASFETLVQSMASQVLLYLGALPVSGAEGMLDLDTAKHQIDLLAVLEEKTRGNLSDQEQSALDVALYESRMRYVSVASRYIL